MTDACSSLEALLQSADGGSDLAQLGESDENQHLSLEEQQALLCQDLIRCLEQEKARQLKRNDSGLSSTCNSDEEETLEEPNKFIQTSMSYNNKRKGNMRNMTIRDVFAGSNSSVSNVVPLLSFLMMNRVETAKLLPATQDAEANEQAMNGSSALTLTCPALIAANLYSMLLSMPGAWGSGLIEMEAVSGVSALFRRWRIECVTALEHIVKEKESDANKKTKAKKTKRKRKPVPKRQPNANPTKRRSLRRREQDQHNAAQSSDEDSDDDVEDETAQASIDGRDEVSTFDSLSSVSDESGIISPADLLTLGLQAALSLSEIPLQKDFMDWPDESREAIMDAVTSMCGTVAALSTPSVESKLGVTILRLRASVLQQVDSSLKGCILKSSLESTTDDDSDTRKKPSLATRRHATSVYIFRGIYPIMAMKDPLPNGETGKQLACETVSGILQSFVQAVGEGMPDSTDPLTPGPKERTPKNKAEASTSRRISIPIVDNTTKTPKTTSKNKGRKKRVSFGGPVESMGKTPALKSAKKTPTNSAAKTPHYGGTEPRPVLKALLGLFQRLTTTKGLDRANLRGNIVKSLRNCLQHLPSLERTHFLRFIYELCKSRISLHRLVGAELIGVILSDDWLVHHSHQLIATTPVKPKDSFAKTPTRTPSSRSLDSVSETTPKTPAPISQDGDIPSSLLGTLVGRLADRSPAVRVRAAGAFTDLLRKATLVVQNADENTDPMIYLRTSLSAKGFILLNNLRQRAMTDEKATVRRACIEALSALIQLGNCDENFPFGICEEEVVALGQLCHDNSMLTRRAAAQALTSLLETSSSAIGKSDQTTYDILVRTWASSVLPMTQDTETGCISKVVEFASQMVIEPIIVEDECDSFDPRAHRTAWKILSWVCESASSGSSKDVTGALKALLTKLFANASSNGWVDLEKALLKRICDVSVATLDNSEEDLFTNEIQSRRSGAWCLFDAVVDQTKNLNALYSNLKSLQIDLDFLGTSWEKMHSLLVQSTSLPTESSDMLRACMRSCLRLLSKLASCVHIDTARESATNLHSMLKKFSLPPDLIGSAVAALSATSVVCSGEADFQEVQNDCMERIRSLYCVCEETITKYAEDMVGDGLSFPETAEESTVRAIYTVGELAIVGFSPDDDDDAKRVNAKKTSRATISNPLRGLNVKPSQHLVDLVLTFLPGCLPGSACTRTPENARAHAFVSIGKLCLRDENLAKKCVTILAREIHENSQDYRPSVQSNALLVLGDLCIRYTSMVDKYLPVMAACLQAGLDGEESLIVNSTADRSAIVRKNALLLLSSLLLQDYIKWRGLLFHRFLVTCADSDDTVAELGETILVGPLLAKSPKLFFNNFVESLFVLNRCMHPIYIAAKSSGDGGAGIAVDFDGINLTGPTGNAKRNRMYELMLSKMSDEEKIGVTARLAKEVLGSALSSTGGALHRVCKSPRGQSDTSDKEYESAFNVLSDAFELLSSPLLRVGKSKKNDDEDQDMIEDPNLPNTSRRVISAKGKLLSKISRKHLIEIVFPILCNLKALLQKSCSPLLKDLMLFMGTIYKSHKNEIAEYLSGDLTLKMELEYDMKRGNANGESEPPSPGGGTGQDDDE